MIVAFDVRPEHAGERFAERFHLAGRERGLLVRPIGRTVYLMPPYVLDDALCGWLGARTLETLQAVLAGPSAPSSSPSPGAVRPPEPEVA